jgi:hydroxypyruvate isomerase
MRSAIRLRSLLGYAGWIGYEYRRIADTVAGLVWRKRYAV